MQSDLPQIFINIHVMYWKYFKINFPKDSTSKIGIQSIQESLYTGFVIFKIHILYLISAKMK